MMRTIAIDGPSGSGKSTIAKLLAKKLGITYLDTGAMYRGMGYYALKNNIDPADEEQVKPILDDITMEIKYVNGEQKVIVNGEDVTPYIRENRISMAASTISKIPAVRLKLVELQRKIASTSDCVLDGRDIGSYVLPDAPYKFFMTASAEERAKRRYKELTEKGQSVTYDEILADIIKRDEQDSTRAFAPLTIAKDAIVIDTTRLSIEECLEKVIGHLWK
ncbi:MAG TPA: (d)CMP kinase [Clostridia bacterium]|jgi:cytidylate kinase|nr:(d)CMP kinase [Clostridia bacterium]